jgi:hypothetical protein
MATPRTTPVKLRLTLDDLSDGSDDEMIQTSPISVSVIPFPRISMLSGNTMCSGCGRCVACFDFAVHPKDHQSCANNFTSQALPHITKQTSREISTTDLLLCLQRLQLVRVPSEKRMQLSFKNAPY